MYHLYIRQSCPYSKRVSSFMKKNKLKVQLRDLDEKPHEKELIKRGGKAQTPYLVDTKTQQEMYESADIIDYLKTQLEED